MDDDIGNLVHNLVENICPLVVTPAIYICCPTGYPLTELV